MPKNKNKNKNNSQNGAWTAQKKRRMAVGQVQEGLERAEKAKKIAKAKAAKKLAKTKNCSNGAKHNHFAGAVQNGTAAVDQARAAAKLLGNPEGAATTAELADRRAAFLKHRKTMWKKPGNKNVWLTVLRKLKNAGYLVLPEPELVAVAKKWTDGGLPVSFGADPTERRVFNAMFTGVGHGNSPILRV